MVLALEAGKQVTLVVAVGGFLTKKMFNLNNWNRLDEAIILMPAPKTTEFVIHHRLESCLLEKGTVPD